MKKTISILAITILLISTIAFITIPMASAGDITPITVTPVDSTAGATTDYSITCTIATAEDTDVTIDFSAFGITETDMVLTGVSTTIGAYSFTGFATDPTGVTVDDTAKTITFTGGFTTTATEHKIENAVAGTGLVITNDQDAETQDVTISTTADSGTYSLTIDPDVHTAYTVVPDALTQTAGTAFTVTIKAVDQYGNTVTTIDTTLNDYTFTFSGPHNAPDGTEPTYPDGTNPVFSDGVWSPTTTKLVKVEAVALTVTDDQSSPMTGTSDSIFVEGINLNSKGYRTDDTVTVTVGDQSENKEPAAEEVVSIRATSTTIDPDKITIALSETGVDTAIFTGTFKLVGVTPGKGELLVSHGATITVTYPTDPTLQVSPLNEATVDNVSPEFVDPYIEGPEFCKNEGLVTLTAHLSEEGLTLTADFSNIDSKYTTGSESFTEGGEGVYTIIYTIAKENTRSDGVYTIPVTAEDAAGNTATYTLFSTTLDNTAPSVTEPKATPAIIQPKPASATVTFTVSVSDALSGVASVTINLTAISGAVDQEMTESGTTGIYEYEWVGLSVAEGTYTLPITATDNVGNINDTEAITLQVVTDTEGPYEVGFTEPAEPICGGLIVRGLYAEDLLTGVDYYEILMNGTTVWATITEADLTATVWIPVGNHGAFERVAVLSGYAGEYVNITVVAYDQVGNPSNETILYVDVIPEGEWCPVVLEPKWNLISLPLIPNSTARADVLSLVLKQGASGVIITHGYNQLIDDWDTDPAEMTDGWGYWLYVLEYDVLIVQGTVTPTPPAMPPTYLFTKGWVLAGFKSTSTSKIADYIASLEDLSYFPYVYAWDASAQNWDMLGTTESLEPGEGFWIWMYEDQYLIPPI